MTDKLIPMLDEIKARHEAATEGPWEADVRNRENAIETGVVVMNARGLAIFDSFNTQDAEIFHDGGLYTDHAAIRNLEFSAHSRTDVPKMERRLRAMQRVMDAHTACDQHIGDDPIMGRLLWDDLQEAESTLAELIAKEWT